MLSSTVHVMLFVPMLRSTCAVIDCSDSPFLLSPIPPYPHPCPLCCPPPPQAFITVNPSIAPPQPYVAPDPLANPPPPSKSSTSILSTTTTNINNNGTARSGSAVYRNNSLPSSGVCTSEGAATSIRFSAATLPSAANLPSAASIPTPFHPFPNGREVGSGSGLEGENNSVLSSYSSLGGGAANGSTAAQNRQQQGIPPQHPLPSAATPAAFPGAIPGAAASATAAAPANRGGAVANHHNRSSSSVLLPPPSPGGSTVFCGAAPSPSGSQMPSFPGRSEEGGGSTMTMQAKLSPAGAAAAAQRRTGAAAAAAAAATGVAPPSPSGSGQPPHHPAAPPSPAGDSLYAISMSGGTEGYGGGSRVSGEDGRGGGAANSGDMVEEGLLAKPATTSGGEVSGGLNGLDGGNVGASLPSPSVAVAAAAGRTIAAAPPAPAAVAPSREGGAAAATSGGLGAARGTHGEAVVQQRAGSKTIELTERTVRGNAYDYGKSSRLGGGWGAVTMRRGSVSRPSAFASCRHLLRRCLVILMCFEVLSDRRENQTVA